MLLNRANLWLVGLLALVGGCATRIVPPSNPANPVTVYVTDYGRHSSILLPMGDGHLMEYSYGDWDFYALNKYKWYIGATKLVASDGSGLGRRILAHPGDDAALQKKLGSKRLLRLEAEQSRVMDLLAELDQRFTANIETMIYNDYTKSYFVKDISHYWLFHTCNAMTAQWLEKLGCKVSGLAVVSNFQMEKAKDQPLRIEKEEDAQFARRSPGAEPVQLSQQQLKETPKQAKDTSKRPSTTQVSLRQR
jgi:hypothetical protein